jgi:single-stranded DNA-binding protein
MSPPIGLNWKCGAKPQKLPQIGIQGSLKIETWDGQGGEKRSKPIIKVDKLDLLGSKRDNENYNQNQNNYNNY